MKRLLIFGALFCSAAWGQEMKFNDSFADLANWKTLGQAQFAFDATQGHDGPGAARLTLGEETPSWQQFSRTWEPIRGDEEFAASVWVKTQGARDGTGAYLVLEFLDAQNQRAGIVHSTVSLGNGAKGWQRLSTEGAAPQNATQVRAGLIFHAKGTAWFDDFQFARTRTAQPLPDLGNATRTVSIDGAQILQTRFAGVGYHAFHHTHAMSETIKNEIVYKRWREVNPSLARLNDSNAWTQQQKNEIADHLRRMRETDTELYLAAWDPRDVPPGAERQAYAREVADRLEFFMRDKGITNLKWYCLTNELQMGRWGALLDDLPKFKDYHQELYNEFKRRNLPLGLLATDASPIGNWGTLEWAAQNMDDITAIYGAHHYFNDYAPDNLRFYEWFENKMKWASALAKTKNKDFLLGEFGSKQDGRVINGKRMDACVYFDTPMEPLVGLQLGEAVIAGLNSGSYGVAYWTFMDFPDDFSTTYANKWGLFKWAGDDLSPRAIYYSFGPLSKFFRGPARVFKSETNDPRLRVGALQNERGVSIAIVNRNERAVPLKLTLKELPIPLRFRKYVYDSANVPKDKWADLPGPVATPSLIELSRGDTILPMSITIYTTAYDDTPPSAVQGLQVNGNRLTWQPSRESDWCFYQVHRSPTKTFQPSPQTRIGSTVATEFTDKNAPATAFYKIVAVDTSGNIGK
jgi:hypothetical protein